LLTLASAIIGGCDVAKKSDPAHDEAMADNEGLDPTDPAVTGVPRDERHDSVTREGVLTDEAVALRQEQASQR